MHSIPEFVIVCREYDKYEGREPLVYKVCNLDFTDPTMLRSFSIRSRYNSELAYFAVLEENWIEYEENIKDKILNESKYEEFDSFIGNGSSTLANNGIIRI